MVIELRIMFNLLWGKVWIGKGCMRTFQGARNGLCLGFTYVKSHLVIP